MPSLQSYIQVMRSVAEDAPECVRMRGLTRENAVSEERLRTHGITAESWAEDIRTGRLPGWVARKAGQIVGYCFGTAKTGEVVVLALLPQEEGKGLGKRLLQLVVDDLQCQGHSRLFLGCAADPAVRSYGFYRHLGWVSTGTMDQHGDEVLELLPANHADHAYFRQLELRRTRALVERDMETVHALHAPEYELITPAGKVFDRALYLAAVESGPFYTAWEVGEMACRISPSMATVRYKARLAFPSGRELSCWHTDTYEKRAGKWQAVWSQATQLPESKPST